jgi:hypothetical protein
MSHTRDTRTDDLSDISGLRVSHFCQRAWHEDITDLANLGDVSAGQGYNGGLIPMLGYYSKSERV